MNSDLAKVLHPLCGKPLLSYSIKLARAVNSEKIVVVIGHQSDKIRGMFQDEDTVFVEQKEQLGTGHAVLQARDAFKDHTGTVLILCGDVPLLKPGTVLALRKRHQSEKAAVTVLTVVLDDPGTYGRVITDLNGQILRIVEAKDATNEEKKIHEINTGIYCVESPFLFKAVGVLQNKNAQGEFYLTDIIGIANRSGLIVQSCRAKDPSEVMGINTIEDLERANQISLGR